MSNKNGSFARLYDLQEKRKKDEEAERAQSNLGTQMPNSPNAQQSKQDAQASNMDTQEPNRNVQMPKLDAQTPNTPNVQMSNAPNAQISNQPGLSFNQPARRYIDSQFKSRQGVERLNVRVPEELKLWTEIWCVQNKVKMYELVTSLLEKHKAEQLDTQQPKRPSAHHDQINRLIDLLIDIDPIKVYEKLTGNITTEKDRADFLSVSKFDDLAIKHGIAYSVGNARAPIKYFSYCLPAIQDAQAKQLGPRFEVEVWRLIESGKIKLDS